MKKLVMLMIVAAVAATASAGVININFYASNGGYVTPEDPTTLEGPAGGLGTTWNQYNSSPASGLLDSTGAVTTVGLTNNVGSGWGVNFADGLTALKSSRAHFGKGNDTTVTISGLTAGNLYNIWIASYNSNSLDAERALGEWSTSNPSASGPQLIDGRGDYYHTEWLYGVNYIQLANVEADANGEISLLGDASDEGDYGDPLAHRLHMNAIQIADVPEPATLALLGLGALVLRRRK